MAMEWNGLDQRANKLRFQTDALSVCDERWHQAAAYRHSHSWRKLVSSFLPGVCARLDSHMNSAFYLVLQQLVFICVTFSCAQFEFLYLQLHTFTCPRTHSLFFMSFSWEHETRHHLWSEFCYGINGSQALSLCVLVCVWCPFLTWKDNISTSHLTVFIISLNWEWACSCYFVQWAVILGPWHQIPFL